ncbi:MAG: hypothetical protein A2539_02665 [Elusimicrobia bacterium RIFOXYD2_FULL_34_15]|nr:MAG: hypothetical protein A2539_02665 [Elusimicrobia bacterium RIFOXYD2_FULL_34_15]
MNENNSFRKIKFSNEQINSYLKNAKKDLKIAKEDNIPEVKFNYSYNSLLKAGITLIAGISGLKVRSI